MFAILLTGKVLGSRQPSNNPVVLYVCKKARIAHDKTYKTQTTNRDECNGVHLLLIRRHGSTLLLYLIAVEDIV